MTSLERMMAAVRGEELDRYPVMNPYPFWSMQPHWPKLAGVTFAHVYDGSDEERVACYRAVKEQLGVDCLPVWRGAFLRRILTETAPDGFEPFEGTYPWDRTPAGQCGGTVMIYFGEHQPRHFFYGLPDGGGRGAEGVVRKDT